MNGTQGGHWYCKSMKNALHMVKGSSQAEATLNSEKIKPIALAIVELSESEGRQPDKKLVSQ